MKLPRRNHIYTNKPWNSQVQGVKNMEKARYNLCMKDFKWRDAENCEYLVNVLCTSLAPSGGVDDPCFCSLYLTLCTVSVLIGRLASAIGLRATTSAWFWCGTLFTASSPSFYPPPPKKTHKFTNTEGLVFLLNVLSYGLHFPKSCSFSFSFKAVSHGQRLCFLAVRYMNTGYEDLRIFILLFFNSCWKHFFL